MNGIFKTRSKAETVDFRLIVMGRGGSGGTRGISNYDRWPDRRQAEACTPTSLRAAWQRLESKLQPVCRA